VTAKEALHDAVDKMTEAEAAALLEQVQRPLIERVPWLRGREDKEAALRLLHEWWDNPPPMSEAELQALDDVLRNPEPVRLREWHP
jgi:hypothetical protein